MNIILLNNFCKRKGSVDLCMPNTMVLLLGGLVMLVLLAVTAGYYLGQQQHAAGNLQPRQLMEMVQTDRQQLAEEKARLQAHMDALSIRLGALQAQVLRIEALGDRLVDAAQLDRGEFNFDQEPAVGGLDIPEISRSATMSELLADVESFQQLLDDRSQKLEILDELIATGQLYEESTPSGRPVVKGWLSSRFGKRIDPKNGKKTFHRGNDYAGKPGSDVIAVASGLVIRSEKQNGFGNMVEIKHPDGYSTLYAHNKENLVSVGDRVSKGQSIALLGSTGRSTGPHVHFEVRRDGKYINPAKYLKR